jgi:hypothetical protein
MPSPNSVATPVVGTPAVGTNLLKFDVICDGVSSTTNNKAHATIIQLNSNGITEVEGALVNGFSHGSIKQTTRSRRFANSDGLLKICIARFSCTTRFRKPYLHSLGAYFLSSASDGTATPANVAAPLDKHFHCTLPLTIGLAASGTGNATGLATGPVKGTNTNLPPPAAGVVVMVIAPVAGATSITLMLLVAPLHA